MLALSTFNIAMIAIGVIAIVAVIIMKKRQ